MLTLVRQFWETIFFLNLWLKPSHTKRDGFELFVRPFQRCCEEEIVHRTSVIRHHGSLQALSMEDLLEKLKEAGIRH